MNANYILLIVSSAVVSSCIDTRSVTNFNKTADSTIIYSVENLEPVIQKNDILSISVSSLNAEATEPFNIHTIAATQGAVNSGTISQAAGFLVDQEGYIQFPMLGSIKAVGLTKRKLKEIITEGLTKKNLLYDPIVNIRYLNYKISVIGEVAHPSLINVPAEKVTLLEALALAGDLTPYASRKNVLIIRDNDEGQRVTHRLNLTDDDLFTSPYYHLKSNDVIYVPPNRAKVAGTSTAKQWLPALLSFMSLSAIIADRITRN
jgi:polysaccharide biosynthesis/export protein